MRICSFSETRRETLWGGVLYEQTACGVHVYACIQGGGVISRLPHTRTAFPQALKSPCKFAEVLACNL